MKPFHTIAIPHEDIKSGALEMSVFAADLWNASRGEGPEEYSNPEVFFRKTYETDGLRELLESVGNRLKGHGGDAVLQVQTPFGGGKTHSMIALYHKAAEWNANRVVIVGTVMDGDMTLWGEIERQLTGEIKHLTGKTSPGREALNKVLTANKPVLILIDELMEYMTKASGVKVGDTTLAEQTIAFMQELSEQASSISGICVLVTLQSSMMEQSSEAAERLLSKLKMTLGRKEKVYAPVKDSEVTKIIRKRLFSSIEEGDARSIVSDLVDYFAKYSILPAGIEKSDYRARFSDSFPFTPEVIDVLYHRWGSYPEFQRTRGVLRILALVIHSMLKSSTPYISLADFDLDRQELRQELIKFTGSEFNSVIASDITGDDSGTKRANHELGKTYQNLNIATRVAQTIFMYSFSGGREHGATLTDIKRQAAAYDNPAEVISDCLERLNNRLFYLQNTDDKYYFSNKPNLNRIIQTKMENVLYEDLKELEEQVLKRNLSGKGLKVFIGEQSYKDIPENYDLKLIVLSSVDRPLMMEIINNKGSNTPRVYRNTILFLCPGDKTNFEKQMKRKLAFDSIEGDDTLELAESDRKKLKEDMKKISADLDDGVHRVYREIYLPVRSGLYKTDLGVPTYGEKKTLDERVIDQLKSEQKLTDKLAPIVIQTKYMKDSDCLYTEQLWKSHIQTPGEPMLMNRTVLEDAIVEGLKAGVFGLGMKDANRLKLLYFNDRKRNQTPEPPILQFSSTEVLIPREVCIELERREEELSGYDSEAGKKDSETSSVGEEKTIESTGHITGRSDDTEGSSTGVSTASQIDSDITNLKLSFRLPKGKAADVMRVLNYLQTKFDTLRLDITAIDGSMTKQDYENKVAEAFDQAGIEIAE